MTTREATGLLPRSAAIDAPRPLTSDRMAVLAYGAIQWPWLLRSLSGGRPADKRRLLDRLGLAHDALPNLGSWKADVALLTHIVAAVETLRPARVVEFGTGASTLVAARALQLNGDGSLVSIDQYADFIAATRDWLAEHDLSADLRAAPLRRMNNRWGGLWYDAHDLPDRIDLLIVDGPSWTVHPHTRGAADALFPRLNVGGMVLLDDALRPGERAVARRWRQRWPNFCFTLDRSGTKGTLIGQRVS